MIFNKAEFAEFYDNRLIISWKISQPADLPPLKKMVFTITGKPDLIFEPNQSSVIELPELENNNIILNWVISKPDEKTELALTLSCPVIEESQKFVFNPRNDKS